MHLKKEFDVPHDPATAFGRVANDETLLGLFPETKTEIVASEGNRRTVRSHYVALGQSGTATFHFTFEDGQCIRFEKVCDGRVWNRLVGCVDFVDRGGRTRVSIEMDGRTKSLVPEFTIKGPMQDQLSKMARALRERLELA
jgi:hypothetical protein